MAKSFSYQLQTRFRDSDGLGHLNNAVYLSYIENCRIAWLVEILAGSPFKTVGGVDLPIILARSEIDYLQQAYSSDDLTVHCQLERIGTKSFTQIYEIESAKKVTIARAKATLVWFDFEKNQSVAVPPGVRDLMAPYLKS